MGFFHEAYFSCLTQHSFFMKPLVYLCHYNTKSWHLVVLLEKGLSVDS